MLLKGAWERPAQDQASEDGMIKVKLTDLSDVTNYTIRAIIIEKDGKSNTRDAKISTFSTSACKKEGKKIIKEQ